MAYNTKRIVISGPESTGKTAITQELAQYYKSVFIPEYARDYLEKLNRPYRYDDVIHIARYQIEQEMQYLQTNPFMLFYDTYLIITKIWFLVVYGDSPLWLDQYLANSRIDLFLLCYPDIPWVSDPVRENPGKKRKMLFDLYLKEIKRYNFTCAIIKGEGIKRVQCAIRAVESSL